MSLKNKTTMKIKRKFLVLLGVIMLMATGFVIKPSQQEEKLIIGTWICKGDNNLKMKFTDKGKCYSYYTDEPTEEFTYSIDREKSQDGTLNLTFLKLTGITDHGFNPEYYINGMGKNVLTLMTDRNQLIFFTKQK